MIWLFLSVFSSVIMARPVVEKVDTLFEDSTFVAELTFSKAIAQDALTVDFINETIQVNIPGASVKDGKILNRVRENRVKSVYTYQFQPEILRVRIIYDEISASKFKDSVQLQAAENVLRIVTALPTLQAQAPKKVEALDIKPQALVAPAPVVETSEKALQLKKRSVVSQEVVTPQPVEMAPVVKVADSKELAEEEIPVNLDTPAEEKSSEASMNRLVYGVVGLLFFAVFGYLYLRRFQASGMLKNRHTSIKMLTQHHLGPKKSLAIIQVAGESLLIGVTDHSINHIKTLSLLDEEVPEVSTEDFAQVAAQTPPPAAGVYDRSAVPQNFAEEAEEEQDDFSVASIKNMVRHRVSGLRDFQR